jgi:hypothetical protein
MSSVDQATQTQLNNIQKKTGRSLEALTALVKNCGLSKHSDIRTMLMRELGLGYGDANSLVHFALKSAGERAAQAQGMSPGDVVDEIYAGAKANLRPIHDRLMSAISGFGEFEIAPKKGYLSLRRKKQFAMLGPATNTRVEVGINIKDLPSHGQLIEMPAGSMCNYKVKLTDPSEVNDELIEWIKQAYDRAG